MMSYRNKRKNKNFETQMLDIGRLPNLITGLLIFIETFYFSNLHFSDYTDYTNLMILIVPVSLMILMQFLIAPITNSILTKKISLMLDEEKKDLLDTEQRSLLLIKLLKCPSYIRTEVFSVFTISSALLILSYVFILKIDISFFTFTIVLLLLGSYESSIVAFNYSTILTSRYAGEIIKKGIDNKIIKDKKYLGYSYLRLIIFYIVINIVLINLVNFSYFIRSYYFEMDPKVFEIKFIILLSFNSLIVIVLSIMLTVKVYSSIKQINSTLESIINGETVEDLFLPTDLSSEIEYNIFFVNQILYNLSYIFQESVNMSNSIIQSSENIYRSAANMAENSSVQDNKIKNTSSSMNTAKDALHNITINIKEVGKNADAILDNVNKSRKLLTLSMIQIEEIAKANVDTINGIKILSDKIENVWSIVNTIDKIAEKTRIIAFNAELESLSAEENEEKFHIIATEIRTLAESVTKSTFEIRKRITQIQHSSDNLIISSEGGTEKINEGRELFNILNENFYNLKTSCEITSESTSNIQDVIQSQDNAIFQISSTLQQISLGFDDFTNAAKTTSDDSKKLKYIADQLSDIQSSGE